MLYFKINTMKGTYYLLVNAPLIIVAVPKTINPNNPPKIISSNTLELGVKSIKK